MPGCMAQGRNNLTLEEPLCISGRHRQKENRRNPPLCGF